jgi:hypothetical protein
VRLSVISLHERKPREVLNCLCDCGWNLVDLDGDHVLEPVIMNGGWVEEGYCMQGTIYERGCMGYRKVHSQSWMIPRSH